MSLDSSFEFVRAVLLGVAFGVLMLTCSFLYPFLPPIVVFPMAASFYLGLTIPLSRGQWVIGLVGFVIVVFARGVLLPGPFMLPIYGLIFSSRRVYLSGAVSSILHVVYGVFLAPVIFMVAPATRILTLLKEIIGLTPLAFGATLIIYGFLSALAAKAGFLLGKSIRERVGEQS